MNKTEGALRVEMAFNLLKNELIKSPEEFLQVLNGTYKSQKDKNKEKLNKVLNIKDESSK